MILQHSVAMPLRQALLKFAELVRAAATLAVSTALFTTLQPWYCYCPAPALEALLCGCHL